MADERELGPKVTGMCLVNTNVPPADHVHVCVIKADHREHRCHCGVTWSPGTSEVDRG